MKCKICDRETYKHNYCTFHTKAYGNIVRKYETWRKALEVSWKEYLSEIAKNPLTGEWAREVAENLITTEEQQNVETS